MRGCLHRLILIACAASAAIAVHRLLPRLDPPRLLAAMPSSPAGRGGATSDPSRRITYGRPGPAASAPGQVAPPQCSNAEPVSTVRTIDGDTIGVHWRNQVERVRLLRINTAEMGKPPATPQPTASEATESLRQLTSDQAVSIEFEVSGVPARDSYGRLLAYVCVDGRNVNVEQVRRGWSSFWPKYGRGRYAAAFQAAELEARRSGRGKWRAGALTGSQAYAF